MHHNEIYRHEIDKTKHPDRVQRKKVAEQEIEINDMGGWRIVKWLGNRCEKCKAKYKFAQFETKKFGKVEKMQLYGALVA